jgi:hypothetical protein
MLIGIREGKKGELHFVCNFYNKGAAEERYMLKTTIRLIPQGRKCLTGGTNQNFLSMHVPFLPRPVQKI